MDFQFGRLYLKVKNTWQCQCILIILHVQCDLTLKLLWGQQLNAQINIIEKVFITFPEAKITPFYYVLIMRKLCIIMP